MSAKNSKIKHKMLRNFRQFTISRHLVGQDLMIGNCFFRNKVKNRTTTSKNQVFFKNAILNLAQLSKTSSRNVEKVDGKYPVFIENVIKNPAPSLYVILSAAKNLLSKTPTHCPAKKHVGQARQKKQFSSGLVLKIN